MSKGKNVVLLSGGLDSSTLLHACLSDGFESTALAVNYGQRHKRELEAAERVAHGARVPFLVCNIASAMTPIFANSLSSQVGQKEPVPKGHYADASMKQTVVPNRNMVLLSIAGALAVSIGADSIAYAAHAGDHPIYPDCRPEFFTAMADAMRLANEPPVWIVAPFILVSKTEIVRRGAELGVPFELTYSCYEGGEAHCGKCGTCFERREAFRDAGVPDPTTYQP